MDNKYEKLLDTPVFEANVYENLPPVLRKLTDEFASPRDKDLILLSSLVVISGVFRDVRGLYDGRWVSPNLYGFIVAPPASNKGIMGFAQKLGERINSELIGRHSGMRQDFLRRKREWDLRVARNLIDIGEAPERPAYPILFIPGNSSSTAIYNWLKGSDGSAIIFETEADALTAAIKQDWGNFSHLLRSAYQHETVSYSRVAEDKLVYIENPHLSVLLSGTPNQVPKLITSGEDGLISRFLFYCYAVKPEWKDVRPRINDTEAMFLEVGNIIYSIHRLLVRTTPVFRLSDKQHDWQEGIFLGKLRKYEGNGEQLAIVRRLGLMVYRISMVLSVLRNTDGTSPLPAEITCRDQDYQTAVRIINCIEHHSMLMHSFLPHQQIDLAPRKNQFLDALPKNKKFSRSDANKIGAEMKLSEKTAGNYINDFRKREILHPMEFGTFIIPST